MVKGINKKLSLYGLQERVFSRRQSSFFAVMPKPVVQPMISSRRHVA